MTQIKKVTIADVAEVAGVSVSTVSLVLSGKGRISPATGLRVNEAIEKLGFVRNRQAASLRGGSTGVIGLIVSDICHSFYAELASGLTAELEAQGYMLFLTQSGRLGQNLIHCFETLSFQGVDGIVVVGAVGQGQELRSLVQQHDIPMIFASRASYLDDVEMIRPDNMQAASILTEHLIHRGHQRIAWLGGLSSSLTRAERLGGFCSTLLRYGLPFHSEWIVECESGQRQASEAIICLLHQNPTISAIVCHNSIVATGAWFGLFKAGRQSGDDGLNNIYEQRVTLAAFAAVPEEELGDIPLIWAAIPAREIGILSAKRILQKIQQDDNEIRNHILAAKLINRVNESKK